MNCVVTADAAHAQRDTAEYIAGKKEDGGRDAAYAVTVKGNQPALQRDIHDKITKDRGAEPDYADLDCSHGRIILRSIWVTDAAGIDFPHADQVYRIRRGAYDITGTYLSKEIVHGITSLDARRGTPEVLAQVTRGQWGIESVHWLRSPGAGRPEHRLRRERPPGHGVPEEYRGQPAAYRRGHRDPPDPPGNLP